ncbi:MAG: single-stranded-DNA-specific exonuclease RecJ, partial [Acidobacteriia bacterium]|nr:single-stranded-DNA-specific exonuclease RecJ [Terriglobia bacterium]
EVRLSELTGVAVAEVLGLGPFGYGNPAPMVMARGVRLTGPATLMKEKHVRFQVRQDGRSLTMKAWNFADRIGELEPGRDLDIAFRLEDDAFSAARGYAPWSATVRDVRSSP